MRRSYFAIALDGDDIIGIIFTLGFVISLIVVAVRGS